MLCDAGIEWLFDKKHSHGPKRRHLLNLAMLLLDHGYVSFDHCSKAKRRNLQSGTFGIGPLAFKALMNYFLDLFGDCFDQILSVSRCHGSELPVDCVPKRCKLHVTVKKGDDLLLQRPASASAHRPSLTILSRLIPHLFLCPF